MPWDFEYYGKDKEKLKQASVESLKGTIRHMGADGQKAMQPMVSLIEQAIDTAMLPKAASYFRVKFSVAAEYCTHPPEAVGMRQCYFSIEVIPVYLPTLVDG